MVVASAYARESLSTGSLWSIILVGYFVHFEWTSFWIESVKSQKHFYRRIESSLFIHLRKKVLNKVVGQHWNNCPAFVCGKLKRSHFQWFRSKARQTVFWRARKIIHSVYLGLFQNSRHFLVGVDVFRLKIQKLFIQLCLCVCVCLVRLCIHLE